MSTTAIRPGSNALALDELVQQDRVHRRVYTDPDIFALEMDRVFAANWVYLLHLSEIPGIDDFKQVWIGTRNFVVSRKGDNKVTVFANRCSHRAATVCREPGGTASTFTCPYHGWKYDSRGQLFGVPGKTAYGNTFKARDMHLARPAQVAIYKGLVFATLNDKAPGLEEHLGHAKRFIDDWLNHQGGHENLCVAGAQRFKLKCNWKVVYDNAGDGYHVPFSHQSLLKMTNDRYGGGDMSYFADADRSNMKLYDLGNGHTLIDQRPDMHKVSAWKQQRPQPGREHFEMHVHNTNKSEVVNTVLDSAVGAGMNLNIFPNLLFIGNQIQVLQPVSANEVLVHWYATQRADADSEMQSIRMRTQEDFPIMGEMDDASNFEECQRGMETSPDDEWIDISRHFETGKDQEEEPGLTVSLVTSELHMRAYFNKWRALMSVQPILNVEKTKL
ncbi:MAG: aromatic ring-hydroxylating dioxygenase subunit alpha [Alcaligenaceae bacterium]|nr:aromatic ring-hydroxylating dioxygenase subunit alpha [Alcaligenaceae bacterium]